MPELLAWDTVWSQDLIDLMVRVAEEIEAVRDERQFMTVAALFSKDGPQKLNDFIARIRRTVEEAQLAARGVKPESKASFELLEIFGTESDS